MANAGGFNYFHDLLQQMLVLPTEMKTSFIQVAQQELSTPTTNPLVEAGDEAMAILPATPITIPPTPVTATATNTIASPPTVRFTTTTGGIKNVPFPPPAPPPTPTNPFVPGSIKNLAFTLPPSRQPSFAHSASFTLETSTPMGLRKN